MTKLRKLLTDSSKARRHRRKILNLQITFLAWLVELTGFLLMFLGVFVLGHRNNVFNYLMQTLTLFIYLVLLPSIFLLNDHDTKSVIVESNLYKTILTVFHCNYNSSEETDEAINELFNAYNLNMKNIHNIFVDNRTLWIFKFNYTRKIKVK